MLGRILLALAGLLMIGAAIVHAVQGMAAAGWLPGERGAVLLLLWNGAVICWGVVGLAWLLIAWRGERRDAVLAWLLAIVPGATAAMILMTLGPAFVTAWLLAGATLFAGLGGIALPRTRA